MTRAETIAYLLEHYWEYVYPLNGPSGIRGGGDSNGFMPPTYTASVRELEAQLEAMRGPSLQSFVRRHTVGFHMVRRVQKLAYQGVFHSGTRPLLDERGWPRRPRSRERVLMSNGRPALVPVLCLERDPDARADVARLGCHWIGERFPFPPEIPQVARAA